MRKINIEEILNAKAKVEQRAKERKQRFYQLQRELYGAEIEILRDENPELSMWEATQIVYNKHKYGVDKNSENYEKELAEAKKKEWINDEWERLKARAKEELGNI